MEIEKKFRVTNMPSHLEQYETREIEQGYLCTNPVVRIRRSNDDYILTYKSKFNIDEKLLQMASVANEIEVPLTKSGYEHLKEKIDNHLIEKTRYIIPLEPPLKAELDLFHGRLEGLYFVEVEFPDEIMANQFTPPDWFGEDVSLDKRFGNSNLSKLDCWKEE